MKIEFIPERPEDADVIAFVVTADSFEGFHFPVDHPDQLIETAKLARFKGAEGQSFLLIAPVNGKMARIVLVGSGDKATDYQSAGGTIISKVQTSGAQKIAIHSENMTGTNAAEVAFGALQKSWRMDKYFTKKPDSFLPSVTSIIMVGAASEAQDAWPRYAACAASRSCQSTLPRAR